MLFSCASGKSRGCIPAKLAAIVREAAVDHKVWLVLEPLWPSTSRKTVIGTANGAFVWVAPLPLVLTSGAAGLFEEAQIVITENELFRLSK